MRILILDEFSILGDSFEYVFRANKLEAERCDPENFKNHQSGDLSQFDVMLICLDQESERTGKLLELLNKRIPPCPVVTTDRTPGSPIPACSSWHINHDTTTAEVLEKVRELSSPKN